GVPTDADPRHRPAKAPRAGEVQSERLEPRGDVLESRLEVGERTGGDLPEERDREVPRGARGPRGPQGGTARAPALPPIGAKGWSWRRAQHLEGRLEMVERVLGRVDR